MIYCAILFFIAFIIKSFTFSRLHSVEDTKSIIEDSVKFIGKIVMQQVVLFIATIFLLKYFSLLLVMLFIAVVFGLSHGYIFIRHRILDGVILVTSGFFGGLIFVYLYNHFYVYGLMYAFLVHIMYHIILDIIFMIYFGKPMKMFKR